MKHEDLLRELPLQEPPPAIAAKARAALLRGPEPWSTTAGRAVLPVVLASVVGLYLFWAFAAAIALNN
jgi:hypothetical protein